MVCIECGLTRPYSNASTDLGKLVRSFIDVNVDVWILGQCDGAGQASDTASAIKDS